MDRSSVTVHVGRDTRSRIEERVDAGESVADWVRDAIHGRLDADDAAASDRGETAADDGTRPGDRGDDAARADAGDAGDRDGSGAAGRGPGYEFVDDCGV